tara:strand:+ start:498 stop:758 length:261 start_codon:yes stop_codon:yes gene_type:complete
VDSNSLHKRKMSHFFTCKGSKKKKKNRKKKMLMMFGIMIIILVMMLVIVSMIMTMLSMIRERVLHFVDCNRGVAPAGSMEPDLRFN